jgi:SNF2 family DNA or RNA helicase
MSSTTLAMPLPSRIKPGVELFPHQVEGVQWLSRRANWLLADEMGLGKTLQALLVAAIDYDRGHRRICVVATASLKYNWVAEIARFTTFTCTVLEGTPDKRSKLLASFDADVLVINYEQIKAHLDELNALDFNIVMFDEAHYIKNAQSKRTKMALKLLADRYFLITGSPLLNRVNELWTLLHRISPTEFPSYWRFRNRYCIYGGWQGRELIGVKNQKELHGHLANYMLRRKKADVLDLPEKQIIPVMVELSPEQRRVYNEVWKEMTLTLPSNPDPMEIESALTRFLRLKQICSTTANVGLGDHSRKLDRLEEMVDEIVVESGESVVIFTQFRGTQEAIMERLRKRGIICQEINGDTPPSLRAPMVADWSEATAGGVPSALVCMLQVAGVGLNMTAASKCIFTDKLFVPKLNEQAQDRLYRIGTDLTKPVQIFELIATKTVEQRIEAILRSKTKLFDELIETPAWKRDFFKAVMEEDDD